MNGIMHRSIHQVTKKETREEHKSLLAKREIHQSKDHRCKYEAWNRRHKQPLFITRVMMMVPMKRVYKFSHPLALRHHVEEKTVSEVFKKGPEKHASEEHQCDPACSKSEAAAAIIEEINNYRQVHAPNDKRMCFGEHFQVRVFKQLGLPFIVDFFELHRLQR